MIKQETTENSVGVDKGLVAMFLKMSPEERPQANDNAARAVKELRHAYKQQRNDRTICWTKKDYGISNRKAWMEQ